MVKSYLKFEHSKTFGLVSSTSANAIWTPNVSLPNSSVRPTGAGQAYVGANEEVLCWDLKKGEILSRWRAHDCKAEVTYIAKTAADKDIFAVGYDDGSIRIWDSRTDTVVISFNGHKSAITDLVFDDSGVRLASGSKDTDIIVWDLVAEVGLYKLRGHKDQITSVRFLQSDHITAEANRDLDGESKESNEASLQSEGGQFLVSTSKDSLIKLWDLRSQHCIETHIAQSNGECWSLGLSPDHSGFITAGNDGEVKVWSVDASELQKCIDTVHDTKNSGILKDRGTFYRHGKDRTTGVSFHPNLDYVALHGSEKAVEIWRIRPDHEVQKSMARKRKRKREKAGSNQDQGEKENGEAIEENYGDDMVPKITDVFVPHVIVRTGGKARSVDWTEKRAKASIQLVAATANNELEMYNIGISDKTKKLESDRPPEYARVYAVDLPGHRTDVRSLSLSSDDRMLASASNGALKIWNVRTQTCIRTLDCGYALCCAFLPGDKIVVVGNKNGELELFDIASSTLLDTVQAHEGAIWALHVHPNGKSVVTGSADKSVKFWNFQVVHEEILGTTRTTPKLKLLQVRTLKLGDDILSLKFSPDSQLIAVALLDNTVKVFFADTLKLFLNLYGHKLPVLNLDISYDSKLIVTCSADKNVRLWGLDFGDCHKAFFAHQDSIMQVAFIPNNIEGNGHHFFSSSKDRVIKYWDGTKFEQIQKLEGHHGEIWALTVSHSGEFLVSASHDKSIRIWRQTDEQLFLEEERDKELEELYENTLLTNLDPEDGGGEETNEVGAAGERTMETLMAGERIAEALDIGMTDLEIMMEWRELKNSQPNLAPPARNPLFIALGDISAEAHVLNVVQKVKAAALQDALLVLPFQKVASLFTFLNLWASKEWNIPLTCRILFFMLRTHHRQIVASKMMRKMLDGIRESLRRVLARQKEEMGFNLAALKFMDVQLRDQSHRGYVDETWLEEKKRSRGKKRVFVNVS